MQEIYAKIPPFSEVIEYITQDDPIKLDDGTIHFGVTVRKIDLDGLVSLAGSIVLGEKQALSDATIKNIVKEFQMVATLDRKDVKVIETADKIIPKEFFSATNKWLTEKTLPVLKTDATWSELATVAREIPPEKLSETGDIK